MEGTIDEIEKFIEEELDKVITQEDKIDDSVEEHLGEMGWLWTQVREKLEKDKVCFNCKKHVEFSVENPVNVVEATKVDPGVIAFVSLCSKCMEKIQKEQKTTKLK